MTNPTPTLTDEQRTELVWAYAYSGCTHTDGVDPDAVTGCRDCQRITDRVIPVVARMVADAEQRGRAEVSAAVVDDGSPGSVMERVRAAITEVGVEPGRANLATSMVMRNLRAALTNPAAAVARIQADRHPEDYCHRCGGPNISWYTPGVVWDPVMRPDGESGKWSEIICPLCFVELAGGGTWALIPRKSDGEAWTSADERARIKAEALYAARDALYCGEGPDLVGDSDIVYGEWLGNRADRIGGDA